MSKATETSKLNEIDMRACRLAGQACGVLRTSDPKAEHRFNTLLHRLARRLDW